MNILFLTDNFPPEVNAPASRTFEHCREWVRLGHRVTVITCAPNFPMGVVYEGYRNSIWSRETLDGIDVIRVWSLIAKNTGFVWRVLDYVSFMISALPASLLIRHVDVIVGTSPHLFTPCAGVTAAFLKRCPFVFELRDLWPESIRAVGAMRNGVALAFLESLELYLYRRSTHIVCVTHAFRRNLIARGISQRKLSVVMNGADLARFHPRARNERLAEQLGFENKVVVGYAGTLGMAQGLSTILAAAEMLQDDPRTESVRFLFVGDGAEKEALQAEAAEWCLRTVTFIDSVPREQVAEFLSLMDMTVIHLRNAALFRTVIPSKLFECMAMGVPVVLGVAGEAAELVEREGFGVTFEPENARALADCITELAVHPVRRAALSRRALEAAPRHDRSVAARDMLDIMLRTCGRPEATAIAKSAAKQPPPTP